MVHAPARANGRASKRGLPWGLRHATRPEKELLVARAAASGAKRHPTWGSSSSSKTLETDEDENEDDEEDERNSHDQRHIFPSTFVGL